jgi:hypothetical protein
LQRRSAAKPASPPSPHIFVHPEEPGTYKVRIPEIFEIRPPFRFKMTTTHFFTASPHQEGGKFFEESDAPQLAAG